MTSGDVMFQPLDVIELRVAVDAWEAGTVGTVLEVADGTVLAEIADERGGTLEVLTIPVEAVRSVSAEDGPERSHDVRVRPVCAAAVDRRHCWRFGDSWRIAVARRVHSGTS